MWRGHSEVDDVQLGSGEKGREWIGVSLEMIRGRYGIVGVRWAMGGEGKIGYDWKRTSPLIPKKIGKCLDHRTPIFQRRLGNVFQITCLDRWGAGRGNCEPGVSGKYAMEQTAIGSVFCIFLKNSSCSGDN